MVILIVLIFILSEYPQLVYPHHLPFGDLQTICNLDRFKEISPTLTSKIQMNKQATILCYGDSFFATNYGYEPFAQQLQNHLNTNVSTHISLHDYNLGQIQKQLKIHPKIKVLILESIEKYLYARFPDPLKLGLFHVDSIFTKRNHKLQMLLKQSDLFQKVSPILNEFKFTYFGDFPKQLTYHQDRLYLSSTLSKQVLGSSFAPLQPKQIHRYLQKIQKIQTYLESVGVQLIVMIIPNKATIEKPIPNLKDYQQIQVIQAKLRQKHIQFIDLDQVFKNSNDLYFKSDTHWNKKGIELAVHKTSQLLSQLSQ